MNIEKVAVIGAGVMGASIAAHFSNAGIPVYLLDIVPEGEKNRNIIAETALKKLLKMEPAPLMLRKNIRLITPGNIEDHLSWLADADWIIEAVIENPKIKKSLYQKLHSICHKDALISSNTSTLPYKLLVNDMPDSFKARFMITHFFNPPRYMRLLELVAGPQTRQDLISAVTQFADIHLGKGCVNCKDTPGFIGNRIGIYWLQCGLLEAFDLDLSIEAADTVISMPFGIPKTGIFGLLDLVGLDLIPHILAGMKQALPPDDAFHQVNQLPDLVQRMITDGYTGRKGKGGFYRLNKSAGKRVKESIDLSSGNYQPSHKPQLDCIQILKNDGLNAMFALDDINVQYAWRVMSKTLTYAASLIPQIANNIVAVDTAMKLGYNWQYGPFELLDKIGVEWFVDRLNAEGTGIPPLLQAYQPMYKVESGVAKFFNLSGSYQTVPRKTGIVLLSDIKLKKPAVMENASASLWDLGDGIACLEFHSKMNTLDMLTMEMLQQSIDKVKEDFTALVIHNEAENFSAGANLGLLMTAIQNNAWADIENLLTQGQQTYQTLQYAPFPVVGAPSGLALGGGCEILLHCDAIQAHAELYIGLVEVGVGLVPAWGGCKEYLKRCFALPKKFAGALGPMPPVVKAFQTLGTATVAKSAFEAQQQLFLSTRDGITMNKDRLLADAKSKALSLSQKYTVPEPFSYSLPGKTAKTALKMAIKAFHALGKATDYDVEVGLHLADVLSGGDCDMTEPLSEDDLLKLERDAFLHLVKQPGTLARLEHMLKTGKPLRN
jgi:3-hydroxyacyl-CoA dehydrogenase